ncbi:MAG: M20/M25/M40 family metallo-hydrolase [Lachnospiraceae bacterium]
MIRETMRKLAEEMVQIPSVNTTSGEKDIGIFIEKYIRSIPYFQAHPEQVMIQRLADDPLERRNVFALLLGEKERKPDTILLHGHTDTVGVQDFGAAEKWAFQPERLMEEMKKMDLAADVRADLESGDYMVGRGSCDMKSGDAVFLGILKEMSERVSGLSGNILVSFNPVEENLHTGIIEALDQLLLLRETYGLEYKLAINNDFICPLFPGDDKKTIYTGTVGKLLPCFYIQGKETHVGQCFEGFDASMAAAGLVEKLNLNCGFSDGYEGEFTYPPSVLKIKDLKPWYNVQTASEAFVYFNYFVHNASMEEITDGLKTAAKEVMEETLQKVNRMSGRFCEMSGQSHKDYDYPLYVLTYEELFERAKQKSGFCEETLQKIIDEQIEEKVDKREIPIAVIRYLLQWTGIKSPAMVLYYAAPYCPHNTLQGRDERLIGEIRKIADSVSEETKEVYRFMKFFPSLSDSSYIKIDDSEESVQTLINNFPGMQQLYPVPIEKIQKLNIPAVNYGCYGKDAHKWTERVHLPYTFGVLPVLIEKTIDYYLK